MKNYEPKYNKSASWNEIENWYIELVEHGLQFEPMLDLIKHIRLNYSAYRLFGYTSVHKLVIGIYEKIEWNREALHIEFDTDTRKWFFIYHSHPFEPTSYKRNYEEKEGIKEFDNFIKKIKW